MGGPCVTNQQLQACHLQNFQTNSLETTELVVKLKHAAEAELIYFAWKYICFYSRYATLNLWMAEQKIAIPQKYVCNNSKQHSTNLPFQQTSAYNNNFELFKIKIWVLQDFFLFWVWIWNLKKKKFKINNFWTRRLESRQKSCEFLISETCCNPIWVQYTRIFTQSNKWILKKSHLIVFFVRGIVQMAIFCEQCCQTYLKKCWHWL